MPRSRPYKTGLNERLKDPDYVAAYLNAVARESQGVQMLALRDVAEAHKISKVAFAASVNRETLYRTLSARGNPTFATLNNILKAVGIETYYRARAKRKPITSTGKESATKESGFRASVAYCQAICIGPSQTSAQLPSQTSDSGIGPFFAEETLNPDPTGSRGVPFWINNESSNLSPISVNP